MKYFITAITTLLTLASCNVSSDYIITGKISEAIDGDSVTLGYSVDGENLTTVSRSVIENGSFTFQGKVDGSKIYYIGYDNYIEPTYVLLFLEGGNITADISMEICKVTGTPSNDLNTEIEEKLGEYLNKLYDYQFQLYSDTLANDSTRTAISLMAMEVQRDASLYIQDMIRNNIESIVGLFQLVQYADIFENEEFKQLLDRIPDENIDPANNCLYEVLQEMLVRRTMPHNETNFEDALREALNDSTTN